MTLKSMKNKECFIHRPSFALIFINLTAICALTLLWSSSCFADLIGESMNGNLQGVNVMINNGVDVNIKNKDDVTALMAASLKGHTEIVKLLLNKGAEVNLKSKGGWTALIIASQAGYTEIVKLLLDKGAEVNAKNKDGVTALMLASSKGHAEIVKLLLNKGADVNAKNKDGVTALRVATQAGNQKIIELLKNAGAAEGQSSNQKVQSITMESGGVKVTLQLSDFTTDNEGYIVAKGHGGMLVANFLPVTVDLNRWRSQCEVAKPFTSQTIIWVEPTNNPEVIHIILDSNEINNESLNKLRLIRNQLPELKMFVQFRPIAGGGYGQAPILCDGAKIYGATKGPVKLKGRLFSNIRGATIVNADLVLPEKK